MWYEGGCDVGVCGTREGVMWVSVVQGRVGVEEGECGYIHIYSNQLTMSKLCSMDSNLI